MNTSLLAAVALAGGLYIAGQYVGSEPQRIAQEVEANREITVEGDGKVEVRPDVARLSLGVQTGIQPSAEAATELLTTRFQEVFDAVRGLGIDEEDMKATNVSVNPVYDFQEGRRVERGFEASETIEVKIEDINQVSRVISAATAAGANQLGGVQFESENQEDLFIQAQKDAIADAKRKAEQLAEALGVGLGRVKKFNVNSSPDDPILFRQDAVAPEAGGVAAGPPVPSGTREVTAHVTVTYELK